LVSPRGNPPGVLNTKGDTISKQASDNNSQIL